MIEKQLQPEEYKSLVSRLTPHSRHLRGCFRAFWVGGTICMLGQAISSLGEWIGLGEALTPAFTSVMLIFIGTTLTGIGIYDRIGRYAGCGSIVPITGFANSVAAPAMEYRREGMIMGVGAKLFALSGPVIVYGTAASIAVGLIYSMLRGWLI